MPICHHTKEIFYRTNLRYFINLIIIIESKFLIDWNIIYLFFDIYSNLNRNFWVLYPFLFHSTFDFNLNFLSIIIWDLNYIVGIKKLLPKDFFLYFLLYYLLFERENFFYFFQFFFYFWINLFFRINGISYILI